MYEKETLAMREQKKQCKRAVGLAIHKKGRPSKDCIVTEEDKVSKLRYEIAHKDARIKQLELENKLMRNFPSLTERR